MRNGLRHVWKMLNFSVKGFADDSCTSVCVCVCAGGINNCYMLLNNINILLCEALSNKQMHAAMETAAVCSVVS